MPPEEGQEDDQEQRGERAAACFHQGDHAICHRGYKHQEDGHDSQEHVDEFSEESPGGGVLQTLQLHHLLLLLLQLHLGDSGLTCFQRLLQARDRRVVENTEGKLRRYLASVTAYLNVSRSFV